MRRRHLRPPLALLAAAALACSGEKVHLTDHLGDPAYPDDHWTASTPEAEGMDGALLADGVRYVEDHGIGIHSFLVVRHGRLVLEQYGSFGRPFTPYDLHIENSVTKTFTGMLVGMAISDGSIASVSSPVLDWFADDGVRDVTADKLRMTVEDLLTMRSGLSYNEGANEGLFVADHAAVEILSLTQRATPGTSFNYSSGDAHVLAEILRRATGQTPLAYAQDRLFGPMGVTAVRWDADPSGTTYGPGQLWLRPRDLARFGQLLLSRGAWEGRQLVPAAWVDTSTTVHVRAGGTGGDYGYQCWIPRIGGFAARGFEGQDLYVFPDRDLVVVFNASIYWPEADGTLDELVSRFVLPAIRD